MEIIFLIVGLSVVLFFVGAALIYRGMLESPNVDAVVPKSEFELISGKLNLAQKEEEGLKLQLDSLAVELHDAKAQAEGTEKIRKDIDFLRERDRQYQDMVHQLEDNLNFLARKADGQAKKAIDVIEELNRRNQALESALKDQLEKVSPQELDDLHAEKQSLEQKLQENKSQIDVLQHELKNVKEKSAAELTEASNLIETLRSQNKVFELGISQITQKVSLVEKEFSQSQMDKNQQLQNAMQLIEHLRREQDLYKKEGVRTEDAAALESELNRIKSENEGRLAEAHQHIARLQEDVSRLQREIQDNQQQRIHLQAQIDANASKGIEGTAALWLEEKQKIEQDVLELKETNQFLRQKERLLSQELLRSQTQALGLEKICQEFKKRIERE